MRHSGDKRSGGSKPSGDTIIAVASPPGRGGLAVIRLSGKKALPIALKIFRPAVPRRSRDIPVRRLVFGRLSADIPAAAADSAFAAYFRAPRSYTGEDVVEIFCHGSPVVVDEIVRWGVSAGARLAHPGEFTFRAYASGRIDLLQAEALNDLIHAETAAQARLASRQLSGSLSNRIAALRRGVVDILAGIEALIEFPDDCLDLTPGEQAPRLGTGGRASGDPTGCVPLAAARDSSLTREREAESEATDGTGIREAGSPSKLTPNSLADDLARLSADIASLVRTYEAGRSLVEGLTLVLAGGRNTGKSTLFNALLGEGRAIVTPQPGTTRDFLREKWISGRSIFHLVDTAGWGKPSSPAESAGMEKSRELASEADGLLIIIDRSRRETLDDLDILAFRPEKKAILVFNKSDLPAVADIEKLKAARKGAPALEISAFSGSNMERLRETIAAAFTPPEGFEEEMILHGRQKSVLQDIGEALGRAEELLRSGHSEEICAEEIRQALPLIGRLTGEIKDDEILEDIFSRFCVGK